MLFESHEDAERNYKELAKAMSLTIVQHQLTTAYFAGLFSGMFDIAKRDQKAKKDITEVGAAMAMLEAVIEIRNSEIKDIHKETKELPLPAVDNDKFLEQVSKVMNESKKHMVAIGDKEGRKASMETLMTSLKANKDKLELDDESPETD